MAFISIDDCKNYDLWPGLADDYLEPLLPENAMESQQFEKDDSWHPAHPDNFSD